MSLFSIAITLAAVTAPQVFYFGPPQRFKDQAACEQQLPKAEVAVEAIIRRDPDSLALFGNVTGPLSRAYFISEAQCQPADDAP